MKIPIQFNYSFLYSDSDLLYLHNLYNISLKRKGFFMTYFKDTLLSWNQSLLFSCYNTGCGKKDSGTQSTIQHGASTKFEGEAPQFIKSMVDEEMKKTKDCWVNPTDAKIHYS